MYKYLIMFALFTPLIGVWRVEQGAYAASVGIFGYQNGATLAFSSYLAVLIFVTFLSVNSYVARSSKMYYSPMVHNTTEEKHSYVHFSILLMMLNFGFLLIMLFVFDGAKVWFNNMDKGIFRASLGSFGAFPYMMTKFVIPALFAYSTLQLVQIKRSSYFKYLWYVNAFLIIVVGSTWGFKTTGLFMMLPSLLILNWRMPVHKLITYFGSFFLFIMLFFTVFDAQSMEGIDMIPFLFDRLTVLQGDVSWYIWGIFREGYTFPNYWPTLLAAMGDSALSTFVSNEDLIEWISYHYDLTLTYLAVDSLHAIETGHSIVGTPFSEGIIAGGLFGMWLFAALAGIIIGRFFRLLDIAIRTGHPIFTALLSTYFCFHVFAWLTGGGITQLFHFSIVINLLISYGLIMVMLPRRHSKVRLFSNSIS